MQGEQNSQAPASWNFDSLWWHNVIQAHFHRRKYFSIYHTSFRRNPLANVTFVFHRISSILKAQLRNNVLPSNLSQAIALKIHDI